LLSGYRGAGKTTELLRLKRELDHDVYFPVYFDVEDYFNTELPLEAGTFLVALAAGFVDNLKEVDGLKQKLYDRIRTFFQRLNIDAEVSASISGGPASLDLRATLRDDESFRAQVKKALESNRKTFKEEMHAFFSDLANSLPGNKTPVFIVDSIEHYRGRSSTFDEVRDSVEALFSHYASELALPGMHVVYTVPVYVKPAGWDGDIWPVLNVKVRERSGEDCREGIDLLRQVLAKRAPDGDVERLLGTEVDRVIRASGGLFRELFRMVSGLLLKNGPLPVRPEDIDQVERQQRSQAVAGLTQEQWEILRQVKDTQQLIVPRELTSEAWTLQALGYVLCYRNGTVDWYGVHPLLESLLDED